MFLSSSLVPAYNSFSSQSSYLVLPSFSSLTIQDNLKPHLRNSRSLFNETESISTIGRSLNDSLSLNSSHFNLTHDEYETNNSTEISRILEKRIAIVVPILFSLIFIVGLFGNALVVIVVVFNASMRSTTNLLILNLAIADLLFILFCVPFTAVDYALSHWPFGVVWCKIVQYLILVSACASNYTLVHMSLDRYLAVVHPINSMSIRIAKNAYIAILLTWIFILVANLPAIQTHTLLKYGSSENAFLSCTFNSTSNLTHQQFQMGFMISSYVIPLLIAFALYFLMLKKLWFGSSTVNNRMNNVRCRKRVTRMVIVVVLTFAICWAPIQIILVLKSVGLYNTDAVSGIVIQIASQVLAYTNSCVNPILYAFLSENFRKAFHKVIACNLGGIYGVTQSSYMQQTGQTSVAPTNFLTRTNSQMKRNNNILLTNKSANDLNNNNAKDLSPDIIESNRCLKSVNFSIIADGGLFPRNNPDQDQFNRSTSENNNLSNDAKSLDNSINQTIKSKILKPTLSSKGRFKAKCLDDELDDEFDGNTMELHPTKNIESLNEYKDEINKKTVPLADNSINDLQNESTINESFNKSVTTSTTAAMNTVTSMSNVGSKNSVFL